MTANALMWAPRCAARPWLQPNPSQERQCSPCHTRPLQAYLRSLQRLLQRQLLQENAHPMDWFVHSARA